MASVATGPMTDDFRNPERPEGVALHQIIIEQVMTEDGDIVDWLLAETVEGDPIPLTAALGMLRLAEDTVIRTAMGETP